LVGIGFVAQGPYASGHFQRTDASYAAEHAWMFEGVQGRTFGDYGLSGGGAAGFELDRADPTLGTPAHAVTVARSTALPPGFQAVYEELLTDVTSTSGDPFAELVRADMVYFENPNGGAVFSSGSITFCGSLWNGTEFDGPVSRILENVICRYSK
jgi:N,N-dimethylformamidase